LLVGRAELDPQYPFEMSLTEETCCTETGVFGPLSVFFSGPRRRLDFDETLFFGHLPTRKEKLLRTSPPAREAATFFAFFSPSFLQTAAVFCGETGYSPSQPRFFRLLRRFLVPRPEVLSATPPHPPPPPPAPCLS